MITDATKPSWVQCQLSGPKKEKETLQHICLGQGKKLTLKYQTQCGEKKSRTLVPLMKKTLSVSEGAPREVLQSTKNTGAGCKIWRTSTHTLRRA